MAIEKTGFQAQETSALRQFPERLATTEDEGTQICVPDGYTPGERTGSGEIPSDTRALWNSRERGEERDSPPQSFLKKLGISIALGITGLAILPAAFNATPAGAQPAPPQSTIELLVTTEGEGTRVCIPDGSLPGDGTRSNEAADNTRALWNSGKSHL